MNALIALLAAVVGYLIGSFSFARLMARQVAPGTQLATIRRPVPGSDQIFEAHSISATAVRIQLGGRYGCLTAILDACKAALPALVFKLWQPDAPYYLIAATLAIIGHIYPLYYRFQGGRGLSTVYGGLFVLDWFGVLVTNLVGMVAGILLDQVFVMRLAGLVLMIPWVWFRTHDLASLAYVVVANALYWTAMLPEFRQYFQLRREGLASDPMEVADLWGWRRFYQRVRPFSLAHLIARRRTRTSSTK
jgi:glycerol-3-phosphate acyltransferase PlsY